jgi:hypothetical protein
MPSSRDPEPRVSLTEYTSAAALPAAALALLETDFFSTKDWYQAVTAAALPEGAAPVFVVLAFQTGPAAVFPMLTRRGAAASLTTPYSCRWQPAVAPGLRQDEQRAVWHGFAAWCRRFATIRLDALDAATAATIAAGLRRGGPFAPVALPFDHFGNWHAHADEGTAAYLAARPGHVRETIRRRGKQVLAAGGRFAILSTPFEVEAGITAYEAVYAKSWKTPEPFPAFNPTLMRLCAENGSLRLGLLSQDGAVLAAQFWVVRGHWAVVLKLAHDEAAKALSPGTLLTAFMIDHLLSQDGVTELDFGRGDDAYKQSWAGQRRQRVGLVLANRLRAAGITAMLRHYVARAIKRLRRKEESASF